MVKLVKADTSTIELIEYQMLRSAQTKLQILQIYNILYQ